MANMLGYLIFGIGWPVLIIGSIWLWRHTRELHTVERTLLMISLLTFYVLGYVCTIHWLDYHWLVGAGPAFIMFLALFITTIWTVKSARKHGVSH